MSSAEMDIGHHCTFPEARSGKVECGDPELEFARAANEPKMKCGDQVWETL